MPPLTAVNRPVESVIACNCCPIGTGTYALARHDPFGAPLTIASSTAEMQNAKIVAGLSTPFADIAARSIDLLLLCPVLKEPSHRERAADNSEDPADDLGLVSG